MPEATSNYNAPRRQLLALVPCALVAADIGLTATAAATATSPDAELIRTCQQFAEAEFTAWYRYIVAPDGEAEFQDIPPDWATLRRIEVTPARTPAGYSAKALAFAAWHRDAFDDPADSHDGHTALLASLLRDLAAPARAAIIARLAERYGPLPEGYTADGMWIGRTAA